MRKGEQERLGDGERRRKKTVGKDLRGVVMGSGVSLSPLSLLSSPSPPDTLSTNKQKKSMEKIPLSED